MNEHREEPQERGEDGDTTGSDLMRPCISPWRIINHHQNMSNGISNVNDLSSDDNHRYVVTRP